MAITKAVSANPVRGYYVTTIFNGRKVLKSGSGFGLPRLGGLINARVDGLATDSAAGRMLASKAPLTARQRELAAHAAAEQEKQLVKEHTDFVKAAKEVTDVPPHAEVKVEKDETTGEKKVAAHGTVDAGALEAKKADTKGVSPQK